MPKAKIVYNGAGGGGDLFEGKKFYLMQRIPAREKFKELITSNGGELVTVEGQADMIIGDHARANQPVGSISWRYIEESVKKGELQNIEDHRAGPATKTTREVGSTQLARRGRTPFTAEDDRVLMEWVTRAERQGMKIRGNLLFQQLEQKNNRHTYQSWRDRWVKYLDQLPRPNPVEDENEEEEEEDDVTNGPQSKSTGNKHTPQLIASRSKNPPRSPMPKDGTSATPQRKASTKESKQGISAQNKSMQRESVPISSPPQSSSPPGYRSDSNVFTEEETERLIEFYKDILTVADDQTIDFWLTWAAQNKEHTAQAWCNHFREFVVPKMETEAISKETPPLPESASSKETALKATSPEISPQDIIDIEDSQEHTPTQTMKFSNEKPVDPSTLDELLFKEDLLTLAQQLELDVDFLPTICGRRISLFKLWQLVESEDFGGFDAVNENNLWPKIASQLNFNPSQHPTAPEQLRICFDEILADFEDARRGIVGDIEMHDSFLLAAQLFETANHEMDPEDVEEIGEIDQEEEQELDDDLDLPQFSSPQRGSGSRIQKRASVGREGSPYSKRLRVDKGKGKALEIPSTPEGNLNTNQMFRPQPSPLKNPLLPEGGHVSDEEDSDDQGLFVPEDNKLGSNGKRLPEERILEPETQEFNFPDLDVEASTHRLSSPFSSSPRLPRLPDQSQLSNATTRGSAHSTLKEDSSTQSQTESQKFASVQRVIDDLVEKGFPEAVVVEAITATTLELGPNVEKVAESLDLEQGIPDDIAGVWTSQDDEALDGPVDGKEYHRILLKHGLRRLNERRKHLLWKGEILEQESL